MGLEPRYEKTPHAKTWGANGYLDDASSRTAIPANFISEIVGSLNSMPASDKAETASDTSETKT